MNLRCFCRPVVLAVAASLAACQTMGVRPFESTAPLSPAERHLEEDQKRFADTVISGVIYGTTVAAAGCALKGLVDGDTGKKIARNATICGLAGGLVTGVDAFVVAKKEEAGRKGIRAVDAAAADMKVENARLGAYLDKSNAVLEEGRARLASLRSDLAARKVSAAQAQRAQAREERNIESMRQTLAAARDTCLQYANASAKLSDTPENKRNFDAEISRMDLQIRQLEQHIADYAQALQVSRA